MTELLDHSADIASRDPDACICGSGLSDTNCCGLDLQRFDRPGEDQAGTEAQVAACSDAYRRGDRVEAKRLALDTLERVPGQRHALLMLFHILKDEKRWPAASAVIDRLAHLHLNDAAARMAAVQYFLEINDLPRAQLHARMLVRLAPEAVISHVLMGRTFLAQANGAGAEHHFRIALDLPVPRGPKVARDDIEAHLAVALSRQGRVDEGREIFERVSQTRADDATFLLSWAGLEEAARNFGAAVGLLERAALLARHDNQISVARAALYRRMRQPDRALELLDGSDEGHPSATEMLQRGQLLDSMGRYAEAFSAFAACKASLREHGGQGYQAERARWLVSALRDFFTEGRSRLLPRAEVRSGHPQPIFIVGFPRSGTTLVEQTLSTHREIAAGDELPFIHRIAEQAQATLGSVLRYPAALSELWFGDRAGYINSLRDIYLNEAIQIGAADPAKSWFTDKMPLNETHLGLISMLFPKSPIIHVVRHPLDVVLSVFSNALTHGFNCAASLESAAEHYVLIADLIAHYRSVLPLNYQAFRYEELVLDQENRVRAMFEFIGEQFDPSALAFHENSRPARTASYAQVTEKLYDRSVYRYRNYLKQLEPVIPILQPVIDRLGYTIET